MANLYLLALLPPEDLTRQIHEIRLECSEKFGVKKALKPPVHITLYRPFFAEDPFEKQLIRLLHQGTSGVPPFTQQLENFGSFNTQVVFINALKTPELISLHRAIISIFRKNHIDKQEDNQKSQAFKPHITIAYRDVLPEVFPKIWQEYKDRKFKRSFTADHFTLLKHDKVQWNPIEHFKLEIPDDQPSLF